MHQVNMHEAKTHLSRLVSRLHDTEEIIIAKGGKPVAKLVPYTGQPGSRTPGKLKGRIWIADDFDQINDQIADAFEGIA